MRIYRGFLCACVMLAGCGERGDGSSGVVPGDSASKAPSHAGTTAAAASDADTLKRGGLAVSGTGVGALRIGMTAAEARAALPGFREPPQPDVCVYARATSLPDVMIMVENGVVVRVDVDTSAIPTVDGARVGDSIARVTEIYGARVSTSPNHYTSEPQLTIRASQPADTIHEIIFETIDGRVVSYHAGQRPQVRYIEGCS